MDSSGCLILVHAGDSFCPVRWLRHLLDPHDANDVLHRAQGFWCLPLLVVPEEPLDPAAALSSG